MRLLAVFSFGQPLTWMKTNVTEAKHTSGNMSLAFQLRINMPKDKCNTLPLKYWTPLLWSQRPPWNDWYFILHQSAIDFSHTRHFDVILAPKENMQLAFCFLIDCCEWVKWLACFSTAPKHLYQFILKKLRMELRMEARFCLRFK